MLEVTISRIAPLDEMAMRQCKVRLDNLTKPLNSLGAFEQLACKIAGATNISRPKMPRSSILLVSEEGGKPGRLAQVFAAHVGADLAWFDAARKCDSARVATVEAMEAGILAARKEVANGSRIIGVGALEMSGAGAAVEIIRGETATDPIEALAAAGSPVIAGICGVILGAAAERALVVLDDLTTLAGALSAVRLAPPAREYLVGSHFAVGPACAEALKALKLDAYLMLGMNLGEGCGAALGISLLKASMHVLNDMRTFGEAEVSVAEDGPGALVQDQAVRD